MTVQRHKAKESTWPLVIFLSTTITGLVIMCLLVSLLTPS